MKERMDNLRSDSGEVSYSDPLTTFLYLLMRNELAAGKVEELVGEATNSTEEILFTNGWLAKYANNLAEEIKSAKVIHLQNALDQAFTDTEAKSREKAKLEEQERIKTELKNAVGDSLDDEELAKLEKQLIEAAEEGKATPVDKGVDPSNAADEAKDAVQRLVAQGHLTQEQAEEITDDINEEIKEEAHPPAEEIVKENTEENMVTAEEAKEIVDSAVEESSKFFAGLQAKMAEVVQEEAVKDIQEEEDLKVLKNGEEVSDDEWKAEHVTTIDDDKWQNTQDELQKQDKEESTTEEE